MTIKSHIAIIYFVSVHVSDKIVSVPAFLLYTHSSVSVLHMILTFYDASDWLSVRLHL